MDRGIVESKHGVFGILDVRGEVDLSWSQELRGAVLKALQQHDALAVRLAAVDYIDSSGIAALVEGFQQARGKQQPFILLTPSPSVRAVLELARLDRVFQIREHLD
ncbi:anti-sigma factor antagonist [Ahniella affigens]|uniref:Anti-sigma factor antagonist n=1 Tax=Ahniella affigens TaxID=2021234 RepID=A0A2P1PNI8_9GAMM|nr:STAS domain-containing protein [Ahniella affigens]AVP96387.1 anti-sigma factor antagonist [Ahniella affigens]